MENKPVSADPHNPNQAEHVEQQQVIHPANASYQTNTQTKKRIPMIALVIIVIILASIITLASFLGDSRYLAKTNDSSNALNPQSNTIVHSRNVVKQSVAASFVELEKDIQFKHYATSSDDRCYKGRDNWKTKDDFAYRCDLRLTKYYGFSDDFRQQMFALDSTISDKSWQPQGGYSSLREIVINNYDTYDSRAKLLGDTPKEYLVSDLPISIYESDEKMMWVSVAEKRTDDLLEFELNQEVLGDMIMEVNKEGDLQDIPILFERILTNNSYVLAISIQQNYYKK